MDLLVIHLAKGTLDILQLPTYLANVRGFLRLQIFRSLGKLLDPEILGDTDLEIHLMSRKIARNLPVKVAFLTI